MSYQYQKHHRGSKTSLLVFSYSAIIPNSDPLKVQINAMDVNCMFHLIFINCMFHLILIRVANKEHNFDEYIFHFVQLNAPKCRMC